MQVSKKCTNMQEGFTQQPLSFIMLKQVLQFTYSQITGKEKPTKALDKYSVYISLATPSR